MKQVLGWMLFAVASATVRSGKQHSDAVYTCPETFTLQGKKCVRQTHVIGNKRCAQGTLMADKCVAPAQPLTSCPTGSQPMAGGCQIKEHLSPEMVCPPGAHDIGGTCVTYSVTGIVEVCAAGVFEKGECAIYDYLPPTRKTGCPVGYSEEKGSCWKKAHLECSAPFVGKRHLAGVQQLETIELRPELQSKYAPGTSKVAIKSKDCEVKLEATPIVELSCPANSTLLDGRCAVKRVEPTQIACSLGESYKCFPTEPVRGAFKCRLGYILNGEVCERTTLMNREVQCSPEDFPGPNGSCIKVLGEAMVQCPAGATLSGDVCLNTDVIEPQVQVTTTCVGKDCYK